MKYMSNEVGLGSFQNMYCRQNLRGDEQPPRCFSPPKKENNGYIY